MSDKDKVFEGSVPEIYDTYLVPLIFQDFADDLAKRVAALSPRAVLETAAGTGVVTRALTPRLADEASYVVTDLNQAMLDRAAKRQAADARIVWRQADALNLPFEDRTFDVVFCQFGAMFFPDRVAGYREARRVLKPGGRFLFNVWDRIEENDFANLVTEALAEVFPVDPPRFLARTPHGYHDTDHIHRDVTSAEFQEISIEARECKSPAPSARHAAIAYCQGTPLHGEIVARDAASLESCTATAGEAIKRQFGDGAIAGKIRGFVVTARA